ncbi:MAG: nucleoside kinase [Synergistaceae bacterium]|nr:nucleoside kinase [Synergistota bacterium]NLM71885.1 nucleoside kinase [Synergistaceae bacterium]
MAFTITVKNGPVFSSDVPITARTVLSECNPDGERSNIVAWRVNNYLRSLDWVIEDDATVEFIDTSSFEGMEVYRRSLSFLLVLACKRALRKDVLIRHSISEGCYWDFVDGEISVDDISAILGTMDELVKKDLPFVRKVVSLDKARRIFERQGSGEVARLFQWGAVDPVELYRCADMYGYYYAPLAPSTGYLKLYGLRKLGPGMVLRFPTISYPSSLPPFRASKNLSGVFLDYADWLEVLELGTMDSLHRKVAEGKAQEVILVSEAFHSRNLGRIADEVASREKVKVVAIAGPSGSGKTTFSERLKIQLLVSGRNPVTLAMDNYFVDREFTPRDDEGHYDFEVVEALELDLLQDQLKRLLSGERVQTPQFDFIEGKKKPGKIIELGPRDILIMEGIHGLNSKVTCAIPDDAKYGVFVSPLTGVNFDKHNRTSTTDNRLVRRLIRDARTRGHPAESTLMMWPKVIKGSMKYVFPYQKRADAMFNSSLPYEMAVLRAYVDPILHKVPEGSPVYGEAQRLLSMIKFVPIIPTESIPNNSIIREFLGGSCFEV